MPSLFVTISISPTKASMLNLCSALLTDLWEFSGNSRLPLQQDLPAEQVVEEPALHVVYFHLNCRKGSVEKDTSPNIRHHSKKNE